MHHRDRYRAESFTAKGFDRRRVRVHRLETIRCQPYARADVLRADMGTIEAHEGQGLDVVRTDALRIDFDGEVGGDACLEMPVQILHQFAEPPSAEEVRRVSVEMQLDDFAVAIEQRCGHGHLAFQMREVAVGASIVMSEVAFARKGRAVAGAAGQAHGQRQPSRYRVLVADVGGLAERRFTEAALEVLGRGIEVVTRAPPGAGTRRLDEDGRNGAHGQQPRTVHALRP